MRRKPFPLSKHRYSKIGATTVRGRAFKPATDPKSRHKISKNNVNPIRTVFKSSKGRKKPSERLCFSLRLEL